MIVRAMNSEDIKQVSLIHSSAFIRQKLSEAWISSSLNAYPKSLCFVLEEGDILGYIIWTQKSGFRAEAVIELEQIAISPKSQNKGLGRRLIQESLPLLKEDINQMNSTLKHIVVSTRADNHAQQLYRDTLGAEVEATIRKLYSADEVLMIAR